MPHLFRVSRGQQAASLYGIVDISEDYCVSSVVSGVLCDRHPVSARRLGSIHRFIGF